MLRIDCVGHKQNWLSCLSACMCGPWLTALNKVLGGDPAARSHSFSAMPVAMKTQQIWSNLTSRLDRIVERYGTKEFRIAYLPFRLELGEELWKLISQKSKKAAVKTGKTAMKKPINAMKSHMNTMKTAMTKRKPMKAMTSSMKVMKKSKKA